jgi:hypothetical protein
MGRGDTFLALPFKSMAFFKSCNLGDVVGSCKPNPVDKVCEVAVLITRKKIIALLLEILAVRQFLCVDHRRPRARSGLPCPWRHLRLYFPGHPWL